MATKTKYDRLMLREGLPASPLPQNEAAEEMPPPAEPIAQWKDTVGDRFTYLFWLFCFGLVFLLLMGNTLVGFLF
jgi:hypothetical protein